MKGWKTKFIAFLLTLVLIVGFLWMWNTLPLLQSDSFRLPKNCSAVIVVSSGRGEIERSDLFYYDRSGRKIGKQVFASGADYNAIEAVFPARKCNFFTPETIYFSDGSKLENPEMKGKYKFASNKENENVYGSGYFRAWNMYYKTLTHGYAYAEPEEGFFDILTLYDRKSVYNVKIHPASTLAVNEKEGAIYTFWQDIEKDDQIFYERIAKDGSGFRKTGGAIDIRADKHRSESWCLCVAACEGNDFYITTEQGTGNNTFHVVYHMEKSGAGIQYGDRNTINSRKLGLDRNQEYQLAPDTICVLKNGVMKYYPYYAKMHYPGIITYNCASGKSSIRLFDWAKRGEPGENSFGEFRIIGDAVYFLTGETDGEKLTISRMNDTDQAEAVISIDRPQSKHFLVDYYITDNSR